MCPTFDDLSVRDAKEVDAHVVDDPCSRFCVSGGATPSARMSEVTLLVLRDIGLRAARAPSARAAAVRSVHQALALAPRIQPTLPDSATTRIGRCSFLSPESGRASSPAARPRPLPPPRRSGRTRRTRTPTSRGRGGRCRAAPVVPAVSVRRRSRGTRCRPA